MGVEAAGCKINAGDRFGVFVQWSPYSRMHPMILLSIYDMQKVLIPYPVSSSHSVALFLAVMVSSKGQATHPAQRFGHREE